MSLPATSVLFAIQVSQRLWYPAPLMDQLLILIVFLVVMAVLLSAVVLPIIALVISIRSKKKLTEQISRIETRESPAGPGLVQQSGNSGEGSLPAEIQELKSRIERLEAVLKVSFIPIPEPVDERAQPPMTFVEPSFEAQQSSPALPESRPLGSAEPSPVIPMPSATGAVRKIKAEQIESIIGRRWLGWAAVCLILFAAAFFLKFAFDNRWIGELGRVAVGVAAGVNMTVLGFRYHRRGWRVFSQILTGGGIVLLYLAAYAAFGYYHLATQKAAFAYLAILVAEAAFLAFLYNAPAIAIMALVGGFLTPVLLHSDRDQYRSLFGYITVLDIGALALLRHWRGLVSLAFAGTHLLFWIWYQESYHPRKRAAVLVFQAAVFLIFFLAHVGRQLVTVGQPRRAASFEDLGLLLINPFVFFATAYHLLNGHHHDWMGVFAVGMALVYAGAAKILLDRSAATRGESLSLIGVALTFVTIALPIQLRQNWITIAWSVEALLMLWAGIETRGRRLRALAFTLFGLVLIRLLFWDTPGHFRPIFTPVLNKYFLSSLAVTVCLFAAAALYQRVGERKQIPAPKLRLALVLVAIVTLWFVMSVETHTFFAARAATRKLAEDASHERWLGQMALSVLWSVNAGALAAIGFIRRSASVRWASLVLFGLTVIKVMIVDIAQLQQFYRIIVFFVLGVLLLVVAWGYNKAFLSTESSK